MKPNFTLPIILLSLLFALQSCSKESQNEMVLSPQSEVINATVSGNAAYELNVDKYENIAISKQALHYQYSATGVDSKSGHKMYKYVPAADFTGTDEVILSSTKIYASGTYQGDCNTGYTNYSTGSGTTTHTSYITIKLKVIR